MSKGQVKAINRGNEKMQKADKHRERCLTSLVMKKVKIKIVEFWL